MAIGHRDVDWEQAQPQGSGWSWHIADAAAAKSS